MKGRDAAVGLLALGLAGACLQGFFSAGRLYGDYFLPQSGMSHVHVQELAVDVVYGTFALFFAALATFALWRLGLTARVAAAGRAVASSRWTAPTAVAFVFVAALGVRLVVLERQVVSDDEETYRFIAQTLRLGRVVNPLPEDHGFYTNQFVILSKAGWYGKYPVGHPALLLAARAVGAEDLLGPLLAAGTAWLTWRLGRRLLGPRRARAGVVLLALSPHFVLSHATLLSQISSTFLGMLAVVGLSERARSWQVAGALALGAGVLVRPMPGVPLAALALLVVLGQERGSWLARLRRPAVLALPTVMAGLALLAVNQAQAGDPLQSGYATAHGSSGVLSSGFDIIALSVFGAVFRENFWLLGWPVSLLPVALARPRRGALWLWLPVVASLLYRVLVPKTVVATTGSTYTLEAVPVLALLAADGLARARQWLTRLRVDPSLAPTMTTVLAVGAVVMFLPVQLSALGRAAAARLEVQDALRQAGVARALVFANVMSEPKELTTWAYYPPNPDPAGTDAIVYVRWPNSPDAAVVAREFWQRHYGDRPAWRWEPGKKEKLRKLEEPGPAP